MFNIQNYMILKGWNEKSEGLFEKGLKTVKMVGKNKLMIALNFDTKVKHKHIVTCNLPKNKTEADILFDLTMLNKETK